MDNIIDSYLNIAKVYLKDVPGLDYKKMNAVQADFIKLWKSQISGE
jgi:hypothetical protein